MYSNPLHIQPQRLLSKHRYYTASSSLILRFRSTTPKGFCQAQNGSISCSGPSPPLPPSPHIRLLTTWPAIVVSAKHGQHSPIQHPRYFHHQNRLSSHASAATSTSSTAISLADIEYRISELERTTQISRRLTNLDIQHEIWPLLANCTSIPTAATTSISSSLSKLHSQDQSLFKARLCTRILELCLQQVEARRVFLWDWLVQQQTATTASTSTTNDNNNDNNNETDNDNFSPTKFWNEAPHPTKQMFNLVLSSWKNVIIESTSSYSIQESHDAMELMEYAAQQASSILVQMEEEYSSDVAFIQEYNSRIDTGRFTSLLVGAAIPDVWNYSEVIGAWGQCIDGSVLRLVDKEQKRRRRGDGGDDENQDRRGSNPVVLRDGALQKRLRLEASAMKAMMELLESMEEDLYGTFCSETTTTNMHHSPPYQRKKPPPDRVCYNIILASMSRQLNPSLYEMRLVLQRMMERVKFELESQGGDDDDNEDDNYSHAMSFFPDVVSYNALIEARANRAAMFTTETTSTSNKPRKLDNSMQEQQLQQRPPQSRWRQQLQLNSETFPSQQIIKSRFTSSEEEAILAEQTLEEMNHIATVSVRPNIWSYNAVIKAWVKCGTERGLRRSVLLLRSLALNGINSKETTNVNNNEGVFKRIARWGASLLSSDDSSGRHTEETRTENNMTRRNKSSTNERNANAPQFVGVGIANRLNYLAQETPAKKKTIQSNTDQISVGMHSRMLLMSSAFQSNDTQPSSSLDAEATGETKGLDPIGPLPYIESNILPDINTFRLLINAMERRGTITSAQLAEDLLHLLEEYYFELNPTTGIYNSVLNAWSQAGKMGNDAKVSFYAADRASALLDQMLDEERQLSGILPPPNEASFLMVINAMAHAANSALKAGDISDAKTAATNAETLLQKMELQPLETRQIALSCRGSVVRIWASLSGVSGSRNAYAARAQTLLMKMAEEAGHLPIDVIYFNVVLDAWARELSRKDMDQNQVMSRLSRPLALLTDLIEGKYNATPDNSSFNHVIRACYAPWASRQNVGENVDRRNAWEMAFDIYSRMAERRHGTCRPDAHTYTHMFKALACLWPKSTAESSHEKVALCRDIFQSCCQDGQLTKTSFWVLSTVLESSEFMDLLSHELRDHNVTKQLHHNPDHLYAQMPAEWSRNGRSYKSLNRHKQ